MPRIDGYELVPGKFAPAIPITIRFPNNAFAQGLAIIDSGADRTMVPPEMLQGVQGLNIGALPLGPPNVGAGGSVTRLCSADVAWRGYVFASEFLICEAGKLPFALVGREDFYRKFTVKFAWHRTPPVVDLDPIAGFVPTAGFPTRVHQP